MKATMYLKVLDRACAARALVKGRRSSRRRTATAFLAGAAAGGVLAHLLDPSQGRRRRHVIVDRGAASARRTVRATRIVAARGQGHAKGFVHALRPGGKEPPDDVTLAHKVESVVFRDPRFPKGQISVNAERGEVFLRGQVDRPDLILDLEEAVRRVPGVQNVENLLHLPGTPAPQRSSG